MDTSKIKEDLMIHAKGEGSTQGAWRARWHCGSHGRRELHQAE